MDIIEAMCPVLASIVNEYIPPMPRARQIINLEWDGRPNVGCYAAFFKQPTSTWNFKRLIQKTMAYRDQIHSDMTITAAWNIRKMTSLYHLNSRALYDIQKKNNVILLTYSRRHSHLIILLIIRIDDVC